MNEWIQYHCHAANQPREAFIKILIINAYFHIVLNLTESPEPSFFPETKVASVAMRNNEHEHLTREFC